MAQSMTSAAQPRIANTLTMPKKKHARELMMEDIKGYLQRPNAKLLKELKDRCFELNMNFDMIHNKAKEEFMKEKASMKKENPANIDNKLAKRVVNGHKLIE